MSDRYLRAQTLLAQRRFQEALTATRDAVAAEPANLQAQMALGGSAIAAQSPAVALLCYEQALSLQPSLARAHIGRGLALTFGAREAEAIDALAHGVRLDPDGGAPVFLHAAYHMLQVGRPDSALAAFSQLLQLQPKQLAARQGRAIALIALGRFEEAAPELGLLREVAPGTEYLSGICLHTQLQCCDWTELEARSRELTERVRRGERADTPLTFIVHNESPADQRACAQIYVAAKYSDLGPPVRRPARPGNPKLRIGYLSFDFRDHAVSQLLVGVLEARNRARFEVYGLSTGPDDDSELRRRIAGGLDHFLDIGRLSDRDIAAAMAELSIDIAVDLGGHSMGGRPGVLAYRPAPVQVGFLGYPGTLGAEFIDYLIADRHVIPEQDRPHYSEQIIYLPDAYLPTDGAPPLGPPPDRTEAGLPPEGFVYCCFNALYKILPPIFDVWMRVLRAVPGSVLWLRDRSAMVKANLAKEAARRGIDPARLIWAPRTPTRAEHFARLSLADVFLDTQPYNAHTTAVDAIGAAVPIITIRGRTFASRVATSVLEACGLGSLAVRSVGEYEQLAMDLAQAPDRIRELKEQLARARTTAPLFDSARFCRNLEAAYVEAWARHVRGDAPAALWIESSERRTSL